MNSRIDAGRERLNIALLAGEDTRPHRKAIEALMAKEQTEAERARRENEEREREINEQIAIRTEGLTKESQHRRDSLIKRFPILEPS